MNHTKRVPVLIDTLSVRFPHELFMKLVAASQREKRTLSDYVRLLVESHQNEHAL
jgi:predicted DNA-binding protein